MDSSTSETNRNGLLPPGRLSKIFLLRLHSTTKGSVTVRIMGVSAGLGIVVSSLFIGEEWLELGRVDAAELLTCVVSIPLGLIGMLLETNTLFDIKNIKRSIMSFAPSLERVAGRGMVYIVCGVLQILIWLPTFIIFGSFAVTVGAFMVYLGRQAERKFEILKEFLTSLDEGLLIKAFSKHDGNDDGKLERYEFKRLIDSMYLDLVDEEWQKAFNSIDADNDNKITFDEFRVWFRDTTGDFQMPNETFYNNV